MYTRYRDRVNGDFNNDWHGRPSRIRFRAIGLLAAL